MITEGIGPDVELTGTASHHWYERIHCKLPVSHITMLTDVYDWHIPFLGTCLRVCMRILQKYWNIQKY